MSNEGQDDFGIPKTSRDFFRDLEKSASIDPNETETLYRVEKAAQANVENTEQTNTETETSTARVQNRKEKSFYTGSGAGNNAKNLSQNRLNPKNRIGSSFKKATPLVAIVGGLALTLFVIFGSTSLLGAHLEALFTEATDTQYTSNTLRGTRIMSYMLTGGNQLDTTWGGTRKYKVFSPWLKTRLEKSGIKVIDNSSGSRTLEFNGQTISADNFVTTYRDNVEFREAYSTAKRGRVAGFFDEAAEKIYQKLGLSRNIFKDYKETGDADVDQQNYEEIMTSQFSDETEVSVKTVEEEEVLDENGDPVLGEDGQPEKTRTETNESKTTAAEGETSVAKASAFLSKATATASTACAVLKVASIAATTISAVETYQTVNNFINITENYSKAKAGEGDAAAVNSVNNFFTKSVTTTYPDPETGEDLTITGAPLEGEGERAIVGQVEPDAEKASKYSLSRFSKVIAATMGTYGASATACNVANAANAAVSLALLAIPGGGVLKLTSALLVDTVVKIGAQVAVTAALSFIIPTVARVLFENAFENMVGVPAGELYAKGASAANTQLAARGSGQSGGSAAKLAQYNRNAAEVLALDAEIDRKNLSPLDPTNKNTFLGNMASSALAFATTSSAIGPLSTLANLTKSSFSGLAGSASAASGSAFYDYHGNCDKLADIDNTGDIYCNRITFTDPSTLDLDPDDETYRAVIEPNLEFDEQGNEVIKDNSNLARYIVLCTERDSPFGEYDPNIAAAFETHFGVLDNLPFIEDGVQLINAIEDQAAEPWATGLICSATDKNPSWETEMKYYQRYVEDNRILNQFGVFTVESEDGEETSVDPVLGFKERYYETYPPDNSPAGYLARISGNTKEDVEEMLAFVEYWDYIADYDPSTRYSFGNVVDLARVTSWKGSQIFRSEAFAPWDAGAKRRIDLGGRMMAGPVAKSTTYIIKREQGVTA